MGVALLLAFSRSGLPPIRYVPPRPRSFVKDAIVRGARPSTTANLEAARKLWWCKNGPAPRIRRQRWYPSAVEPESEDKQCYVVCKNKKCGQTFYLSYTDAVRSYSSYGKIACRYCHKSFVFDLLHDAHIMKRRARQ